MEFKIKNKRYCCDVPDCGNYAYAELFRVHKGWLYVCKKHYKLKLKKNGRPKENDIGFYLLRDKDKRVRKDNEKI